jgi:hypothetical protein
MWGRLSNLRGVGKRRSTDAGRFTTGRRLDNLPHRGCAKFFPYSL